MVPFVLQQRNPDNPWVCRGSTWYWIYPDRTVWEWRGDRERPWIPAPRAVVVNYPPQRTDDRDAAGSNRSARGSDEPWQPNEPRQDTPQHVTPQPRQAIRLRTRGGSAAGTQQRRHVTFGEDNSSNAGAGAGAASGGPQPPPDQEREDQEPLIITRTVLVVDQPAQPLQAAPAQPLPAVTTIDEPAMELFRPEVQTWHCYREHPMNNEDPNTEWDVPYFSSFPRASRRVTARWFHNDVLKSTRDRAEGMFPNRHEYHSIVLPNDKPFMYGEVTHFRAPQNEKNYTVDFDILTPYNWREMLSAIDNRQENRGRAGFHRQTDLERVVNGPLGQASSITEMRIEYDRNSYDHHRQVRHLTEHMMKTWNFVVKRNDGTFCRLHPDFKKNIIYYAEGRGLPTQTQPPAKGKGKSDGSGTYTKFKNELWDAQLKFNPTMF
jgi:hypothetical protein